MCCDFISATSCRYISSVKTVLTGTSFSMLLMNLSTSTIKWLYSSPGYVTQYSKGLLLMAATFQVASLIRSVFADCDFLSKKIDIFQVELKSHVKWKTVLLLKQRGIWWSGKGLCQQRSHSVFNFVHPFGRYGNQWERPKKQGRSDCAPSKIISLGIHLQCFGGQGYSLVQFVKLISRCMVKNRVPFQLNVHYRWNPNYWTSFRCLFKVYIRFSVRILDHLLISNGCKIELGFFCSNLFKLLWWQIWLSSCLWKKETKICKSRIKI